ncbi:MULTISPECIES: hypothetical protein [Klebsiella pneumoniae complex]|uniref:hypothetical protein n=1 Tax=Klebsiella pneumoniae complex TaxID=3390273 RepID=UPI0021B2B64B|nr:MULTISPECIES: hypothetical protein [Klebsiella]MCT7324389.1 hypothetical protein [Klebsiella quasipneumoniae]WAL50080.1 hypothetical protein OUI59_14565 [Klebsiella variicola subsp. tropica]HBT4728817.1 hypothetical protein [Klebsiella quasipneumoniae subsp. similipneumoniae]
MKPFIIVLALIFSSVAFANNCDCTRTVGRCSGSAYLTNSSGSHGNYRGEVKITSSLPSCSKIEYYVNNTPYSTILSNSNTEVENIFGTSPINKNDVIFKSCYVCMGNDANQQDSAPSNLNKKFIGTWVGEVSWMLVSNNITVSISENAGVLTGTWQIQGKPVRNLTGVSVNDNVMTINFIGDDNQSLTYVFTLNGVSSASVRGLGLVSFSGTVHKT